jgi:enamine deaminase RidA (YjgF/YER057c/UK114 family)
MSTNTCTAEDCLAKLGIHLPDAPTPFGAYVPAVQTGNLLFLNGMLTTSGHTPTAVGILGKDLDVNEGRKAAHTAARICACAGEEAARLVESRQPRLQARRVRRSDT